MMKALFPDDTGVAARRHCRPAQYARHAGRSSAFDAESRQAVAEFHTASSAAMLYHNEQSLSQLSLRIDLRREWEALLQPLGDGRSTGDFTHESYRRLSQRSAAWADARYVRGSRRNVCWNSTAGYLLSTPASRQFRRRKPLDRGGYAFGGGYVRQVGHFDLAIRAITGRAGYRQVDPQPHNDRFGFRRSDSASAYGFRTAITF